MAAPARENHGIQLLFSAAITSAFVCILVTHFPVAISEGSHPFPSRTRKLSPPEPMVLRGKPRGRVGRCRIFFSAPLAPFMGSRGVFFPGSLDARLPVLPETPEAGQAEPPESIQVSGFAGQFRRALLFDGPLLLRLESLGSARHTTASHGTLAARVGAYSTR